MTIQGIDLSVIWALLIAFGMLMYVVLDGFDLGIGILFPLVPDAKERDVMMNTVAPVWDGNETWLVFGGATLFAAFPLAYAVILEALYLPLVLVLAGLIFRGVAFEFRFKASAKSRHWWDKAFAGGSLMATFFQGVAIGSYVAGIPVVDRQYAGGAFDWVSPFPLLCGVGLIITYALLGSTWLLLKTDGMLESKMRHYSRPLTYALLVVALLVALATAWLKPSVSALWFGGDHWVWTAVLVLAAILAVVQILRHLRKRHSYKPFVAVLLLILLAYVGLMLSIWPKIIPPSIDFWQAASPLTSQLFALMGVLLILPVILGYSAWGYYVFRGKVRPGEAYH